jgi:hypothetical protein
VIDTTGNDRHRLAAIIIPPLDDRLRCLGKHHDMVGLCHEGALPGFPSPVDLAVERVRLPPAAALAPLVDPETAHVENERQAKTPLQLQCRISGHI